ncbi:MAG: precorrin-8X methylmutase [Cocleimonas sp.]|nr:precorrin-8X methylmutase [Cocleimonas sp.]
MINFERNPQYIQQRSFEIVRQYVKLDHLNELEKQIAVRMIYACGDPTIIDDLHFSKKATEVGLKALKQKSQVLCDVNLVIAPLNKKLLAHPPLCFINEEQVALHAKQKNHTRSMIAVDYWPPYIKKSIVLIGNAPTALFRLMELIEQKKINKPALIIGVPVGYTGAAESKQYLWDYHKALGIECIVLLGTRGSSALAATAMNALLSYYHGVVF